MVSAETIKSEARSLGFDLVGVCDASPPQSLPVLKQWVADGLHGEMEYMATSLPLRADLNTLLPGVQSVVAVGLNYYQPVEHVSGQARIARYALGRDYHKVIRGKLKRLAATASDHWPEARFRACVDSAPVMEREYAQRAGLGWFGKNTCLIDSRRGSWFLIGVLLTTLSFERDTPAVGGCGSCRACIDACPTGAIVQRDGLWQVDARKCISYLTIEKRGDLSPEQETMVGEWTFGCDVCQEVCPFNQVRESQPERSPVTSEPDFLNRRQWPELERLRVISEPEWDDITQGSAVRRAGREGLSRNATANLANRPRSP